MEETTDLEANRRKKMNAITILIIGFLFAQTCFAQRQILTTMEPTSGSTLFLYDGHIAREVFRDSMMVFLNYYLSTSADGRFFAAIASTPSRYDEQGSWFVPRHLLVFSNDGKLNRTIPRVQRYAWSPDGNRIACVTGTRYEGFGFRADKLIVINTANWSQRVLEEGIAYQDIFWAAFDSMIYTTDYQHVYRINPRTGKVEKTTYKGIYFSPDGKYYFGANYEGGGFAVYERQTNKNVTPEGFEGNPAVNFHCWLPEGSTLVFGDVFREKQVYDVATRTIRKKILGQLLGYNNETKEFIVLKHHRYFPEVPDKKVERIADGR